MSVQRSGPPFGLGFRLFGQSLRADGDTYTQIPLILKIGFRTLGPKLKS